MIQRKPSKRAFTGVVGSPPDAPVSGSQQKIPRRFTGLAGSSLAKIIEFPGYDPERYRQEIKKALGYAAVQLITINKDDQGRVLLDELRSIVDFELWQATLRYREKMTAALAYTIAKNQAQKFIGDLAEQSKREEFFLSIDDKKEEDVEDKFDGDELSNAELILAKRQREGVKTWGFDGPYLSKGITWEDVLKHRGGIKALVSDVVMKWFPTKKYMVGRWIVLHPDTTVRDIPGVPKSTAARLRREIIEEFELFIRGKHPAQNQQDQPGDGTNRVG